MLGSSKCVANIDKNMLNETDLTENKGTQKPLSSLIILLLLFGILAAGAYLRFNGLSWDEDQHLHPDERFLTMVSSSISSVQVPGEYFDTANSSLNPHNRGHTFYVYGTLPLIVVHSIILILGQAQKSEVLYALVIMCKLANMSFSSLRTFWVGVLQ